MSASKTTQRWVLALTSVASLMVALDQLVVVTALSTMRRDLHASLETLEWTVNAYTLSFAVLLIVGAALGDRFGRRRMFVTGVGLFVLASACCALAPGIGWLIVARIVQGAGSALVMPLAMALLTGAYPAAKRGAALGIFTALTGLAVVGGPLIGGIVTEGLTWRWIFWINVPVGLILMPLAATKIGESRGARTAPDIVGVLLAAVGLLGIVLGLVRGNAAGWTSVQVLGSLVVGTVLMIAFVAWELRTTAPMLPMRLFADRSFSAGNLSMLLLYASLTSTVFFYAQYLQVSLGYSPLAAGLRFLPWTVTLFVIAPVAGRLTDRIGARPLLVTGLALQAVGLGWVALNANNDRSYSASVLALVIAGAGTCMAMPAGQNAIMNSVPPAALGKASGTFNTVRQVGAVLGIAVLGVVFSAQGSYASPAKFSAGFAPALATAAALALAGAIAGLAVYRAGRTAGPAEPTGLADASTPPPPPSAVPAPAPAPVAEVSHAG